MKLNYLDNQKTGVLFFDMLNVYFHDPSIPEEKRKASKPVVDNAVRLMNGARAVEIPIFYAMANHRPDGVSRYRAITDTDMRLRPWPNDDCNPTMHGATEGSWEQKVIDEIAPQPQDYIIPKYRWSTFHQTYFDLALRTRASTQSSSRAARSTWVSPRRSTPRATSTTISSSCATRAATSTTIP